MGYGVYFRVIRHLMRIIRLLLLLFISGNVCAQDSSWVIKPFNEILTLSLPANTQLSQQGYVKAFSGNEKDCYISFNYYDTLMKIGSGKDLQISLAGFVNGLMTNVPQNQYDMTVADAKIGGSRGLMIKLIAKESAAPIQQLYYYVTMANGQYYSFQAGLTKIDANDIVSNRFFSLIKFDAAKIKENQFTLESLILNK